MSRRTREQWAEIKPFMVATECSVAHVGYLLDDAQKEIARLHIKIDALERALIQLDNGGTK